jgi:hypothetical protein
MMQTLYCLVFFVFFTGCIFRMKFFTLPSLSKPILAGIFTLKIAAGMALWAVYTWYYKDRASSDIFKYYDDSAAMFNALHTSPLDYLKMLSGIGNDTPHFDIYYDRMYNWHNKLVSNLYNESHSIIRFNALLRLFSLNTYFVHVIIICFLSLAGLTGIYRFFLNGLKDQPRLLMLCVYFAPSVLLWTSGIIKEAFIVSLLGFLLYALQNLMDKKKILLSATTILLAVLCLFAIKIYILIAFLPALLAYTISCHNSTLHTFLKYALVGFAFVLTGWAVRVFIPSYDPIEIIRIKQNDFQKISLQAKSRIYLPQLEANPASLLSATPVALHNVFLRPLLLNSSPFISLAAVENWLILIFIALCLIFPKPLSEINWNPVLMCLFFTLLLYLLVGWITPELGAIVRYKVPALPFFLIAFLHILDVNKIRSLKNYFKF